MALATKHTAAIICMLENERDRGSQYVVFEIQPMDRALQPYQLDFFDNLGDALDHWEAKAGIGYLPGDNENPVYYRPVEQFLDEMRQANPLTQQEDVKLTPPETAAIDERLNNKTMNLNNLDDLKKEVRELGFNPKVAHELEKNMRTETPHFIVKDQFPGDRGQVDMSLHFHKSSVSDTYNLQKFDVVAGNVAPVVANQQYMVLTENKENKERPLVKNFESPNEAIEFFKKQQGNSELALGESAESKQLLASKENGKVNYVNDDFRQAFFRPAIKQTFYLKDGQGFSASQAANLVQDRTVHRDNMMTRDGLPYKAWIRLDFDQPKDQYNNHKFKQFHDPSFGFDLEKTLKNYNIKEMADPAKKQEIMQAMRNGDRVELTALNKENKEVKIFAEAVPRYSKLDFFNDKGTRQKREQFEKTVNLDVSQGKSQGKNKEKDLEESKGMKV